MYLQTLSVLARLCQLAGLCAPLPVVYVIICYYEFILIIFCISYKVFEVTILKCNCSTIAN